MKSFVLLWSKILDSSIWLESKETRLVWITMLAMKDADGIVRARPGSLAHRARVTKEEAEQAIATLSSPDPETPDDPDQGIRIKAVDGGWLVVNHEKYMFSTDAKRAYWRDQKQKQRKADLAGYQKRPKPLKGELEYIKLMEAGASQEGLDSVVLKHLPDNSDPECPL